MRWTFPALSADSREFDIWQPWPRTRRGCECESCGPLEVDWGRSKVKYHGAARQSRSAVEVHRRNGDSLATLVSTWRRASRPRWRRTSESGGLKRSLVRAGRSSSSRTCDRPTGRRGGRRLGRLPSALRQHKTSPPNLTWTCSIVLLPRSAAYCYLEAYVERDHARGRGAPPHDFSAR